MALTMANASNTVDMVCGSTAISVTHRAYIIVCNNMPPPHTHSINDINYATRLDDVIAVRGSGIVFIACTATSLLRNTPEIIAPGTDTITCDKM